MNATYDSVPLNDDHDLDSFDCGNPVLNSWLANEARRAQKAGTARTWVWVTEDDPTRVCAYYSLAPTAVVRDELSRSQAAGYSGDIPGYLLAKLAVHQDLQGHGNGGNLLVDALIRAYNAADAVGGRLVVVDAIDDAAARFYERHDFVPVKGNPHRLAVKMATIGAMIANTAD